MATQHGNSRDCLRLSSSQSSLGTGSVDAGRRGLHSHAERQNGGKRIGRFAVVLLSTCLGPTAAAAEGWKAGAAKVIITPAEPIWMSGYARKHRAEGKVQDLWAKALALEDSQGQRVVLITMDLIGLDRETSTGVCRQLAERHKFARRQVALNTSHTHCGPAVGHNLDGLLALEGDDRGKVDAYTRWLSDTLVTLAGEALAHLEPSTITWGQGYCSFAVNRRENGRNDVDALRVFGHLKGPSDYAVPVLAVRDMTGKLKTVVFGYACHATVLDANYEWSGDYPGYAQAALEQGHPGAVAMFWAGCGGDQAPRPQHTIALTEAYGRRLAGAVDEVLAGLMRPLHGPLVTRYDEVALKLKTSPSRQELQEQAQSKNQYVARLARRLLAEFDEGTPPRSTYPYPVQVWQCDELRWLFLGGEVVVDYALRLKRELGPSTWVAGYSNDVMAYIPSLRVLREGGYEGANAMVYYGFATTWSEEVETQIVDLVHKTCGSTPNARGALDAAAQP